MKNIFRFLCTVFFALIVATSTFAQKPAGAGPPPNNNPNLDDRSRKVDETRLRSAEMNSSDNAENEKRLQAAIAHMKEDFTRIQVVRNEIARSLVDHKPFDYKLLSEQITEINKRASRLNVYMRAHAPEENKEPNSTELKGEEMVSSLVKLCRLIDSFAENPALKNTATIDSKEIAKAKQDKANADRDLLAIIKLSSNLQKKSESLRITAK